MTQDESTSLPMHCHEWVEEPATEYIKGTMFREGAWEVVHYSEEEKVTAMQRNHNDLLTNHPGIERTIEKVQ
jgi:hypothetical protein